MCATPSERPGEEVRALELELQAACYGIQVLGTELRFSARAELVVNHGAISPAPGMIFGYLTVFCFSLPSASPYVFESGLSEPRDYYSVFCLD